MGNGIIVGISYIILYIVTVATGSYIISNVLKYSLLGNESSDLINQDGDQRWSVLIEQNLEQRNKRQEGMPASPSTPLTTNKRDSGISQIPQLNISDEFKDCPDAPMLLKKVMFGTSMVEDEKVAKATTCKDLPERVWGKIPSTNFEMRIGPNYS